MRNIVVRTMLPSATAAVTQHEGRCPKVRCPNTPATQHEGRCQKAPVGWGGVGWGGVKTFMFLCTHRHSNLITFLAVQQTQALLFHDQLPVGWGGVGWGGVKTFMFCAHTGTATLSQYHITNMHTHPTRTHTHILPTFTLRVSNSLPNVKKKQDQHAAPLRNGDDDDGGGNDEE